MNRVKLLFILFILSGQIHGQGVSFFDGTWEECKEQAKKDNKVIFVDAYTDWCGWCKVMDKKTFTNDSVGIYFKENLIAYKMDMERGIGIKVRMKYKVNGFPSFLFLDKNGNLIRKEYGYQEPPLFLANCKLALEKPDSFNYNVNVNDLDLNFPSFFVAAHQIGDDRKWPSKDTVVDYLNNQSDLFSEVNWAVMSRFPLDAKWNDFFLKNTDKYALIYGKSEVDDKIASVVYAYLQVAIKANSESQLNQTLMLVDSFKMENAAMNKNYYKSMFYKSSEDWNKYAETIEELITLNGYKNLGSINDRSWTIYKSAKSISILTQTSLWMKEVTTLEPSYMYLDTYAALLYKLGDLKEAKIQAEKAIAVGKSNEDNVDETKVLLQKIKKALRK